MQHSKQLFRTVIPSSSSGGLYQTH
jgi:hypothetical protein